MKKKKTRASVIFLDGFATNKWQHAPFWWFCYKEGDNCNVVAFLYGDGSKLLLLLLLLFYFLFYFIFRSLWFSSLKLTINNEMLVFFMLKVAMARGRKLKKGDLVVRKQNVSSSNLVIVEENVVLSY
jgi:hypothetical protein